MFKKFQLKNGLKVLFVESKKSPVVSVQMWVKTGSADETKGEEGISHFIEHLLFKGTRKFKLGQIASTIEGSGGELNAYTSLDQTVYYITISKHYSEIALDTIYEMIGYPLFDPVEIDNEREVVLEEIKRGQDNPHRRSSQLLFSTIYKKHPYGLPVIGFEKVVRNVTRKKLLEYFHGRYVPSNLTLLVVGDFDHVEMRAKVTAKFGDFPPNKLRKVVRAKEPAQLSPRAKIEKVKFEETLLNIAWRIPSIHHPDIPAIEVLALILGQGDSSRLTKRLRLNQPLVHYVSSSSFTSLESGFFVISLSVNRENLEAALNGIREDLEEIMSSLPSTEELRRAVVNLASEEFYSLETVDGMSRKFGSYEHLFGDFRYFDKFIKSVYTLAPEDIYKVARKYLNSKNLSLTLTTASEEKEAKKILNKWIKSFPSKKRKENAKASIYKKPPKLKWKLEEGQNQRSSLPEKKRVNGGVLITRVSHETPVINLRCAFRGGVRVEPQGKEGLTELLSRTWATATKSLSELKLYEEMESMAAGISAFGGRNTSGLNLTAISAFWPKILDIFGQVLSEPLFSKEIVDREKVIMLEQLKLRNDNPAQIAIHNFMKEMFGSHPYGRDPLGSEESLESLGSADLQMHYGKMVSRGNFAAVASGHFEQNELADKLSDFLETLKAGSLQRDQFSFQKPKEPQRVYAHSDKEQTHIVLGYPGLTFTDEKRYTLQILQSILAGQGGRLFIELRDKASLAYSVSPLRMEGIDAGYFGAYIGCSPEKGSKAIEMMKIEFQRLCDQRVSDGELERAKRYLIGRHDIDLQRNSAITAAILFDEVYDVDYRETFEYAKRLDAIDSQNVQELAREIFSQTSVTSAGGKICPWK
ncbi:MAG: insulinase family protein [Bdellovibrionales bacterium]|nr:insulinase family protein [Bdellovibrionales bacterium]